MPHERVTKGLPDISRQAYRCIHGSPESIKLESEPAQHPRELYITTVRRIIIQKRMIDLHCHILPRIDDGATSWEETAEMCRIAAHDGVSHIVATPHANGKYRYDREGFESLRKKMQAKWNHLLDFSLGCDFHFSYENIEDVLLRPQRYTIANSNYLLLELSDFSLISTVHRGIFRLVANGILPLVTHPERNPMLLERPEHVMKLIEYGCLMQVTAGAFTGHWGQRSQQMAEWLLSNDAIYAVASDAHDTCLRPPILSAAYDRVSELTDNAVADALFVDNPGVIVSTNGSRGA